MAWLHRPNAIVRLLIILSSIIILPLLGVSIQMTGEDYDYYFYADGGGPTIVGIGFMVVCHNERRTSLYQQLTNSLSARMVHPLGVHRSRLTHLQRPISSWGGHWIGILRVGFGLLSWCSRHMVESLPHEYLLAL